MNFTFQRNPERLLDLCGLSPIRDRRQEKLFMEKAAALDARDLRPLVLVIGGPYGFSEEVYKRSDARLSLSRMTFSHQIVRAIFAEQIYRAFTILNNEPYHHE